MGQFNGLECEMCHSIFQDGDDIVVCPVCGTPYHKKCYKENGKCIHEEEHGVYEFNNPNMKSTSNYNSNQEDKDDDSKHNGGIEKNCPNCGVKIDRDDKMCNNCGAILGLGVQDMIYSSMASFPFNMNEKIFGIETKDWINFLGPNAISFLIKFKRLEKNGPLSFSFNFGAAIFRGGYFIYRKMYLLGIMFILLEAAIWTWFFAPIALQLKNLLPSHNVTINEFIQIVQQSPQFTNLLISNSSTIWFIKLVFGFFLGLVATLLYKNFAVKKIKSVQAINFKNDIEYSRLLSHKGSVNYMVVIIWMIILLFMYFTPFYGI